MIDDDVKQEFEKVNARLDRIEQFLPTVATKADLERSATKDDLERFATKEDVSTSRRELEAVIETLATKADLERFATKADLERFATKDELERLRDETRTQAELTRQHFDVIAESLRDEIRLGLEGNIGVTSRVETLEGRHERLERRVSALEASRARPKK